MFLSPYRDVCKLWVVSELHSRAIITITLQNTIQYWPETPVHVHNSSTTGAASFHVESSKAVTMYLQAVVQYKITNWLFVHKCTMCMQHQNSMCLWPYIITHQNNHFTTNDSSFYVPASTCNSFLEVQSKANYNLQASYILHVLWCIACMSYSHVTVPKGALHSCSDTSRASFHIFHARHV